MQNFLTAGKYAGRTIVISDIHGNLSLFDSLLEKLEFKNKDRLVLDGDYINRGSNSYGVLRRLMMLSKRPETYIMKGNIERLGRWYFDTGRMEDILPHFKEHTNNLFFELAREIGYKKIGHKNFYDVRAAICRAFPDIISFIDELPVALDTPDILYTHSGINGELPWQNSAEQQFLKNDDYLAHGVNNSGKWLVVGHMPTWNVSSDTTNNILIDNKRRIIGIDGGNCVKSFAQLNALIIETKEGSPIFSQIFADESETIAALESYYPTQQNDYLKNVWPHNYAKLIEKGEYFSLFEILGTGCIGMAKNEHLVPEGERYRFIKSTTPLFLSVLKGDKLYLLDGKCEGYAYVKNTSGICGWVPKRAIEG